MRGYDDKFIYELKSKNDIVDTIGRYVRLTQKGGNFWGCCPFHHEKTPSFAVNPQGQFYHCFGCHESGDVITFVSKMESLDFGDTVKLLAERVKMQLPEIKYDDEKVRKQKQEKERGLKLLRDTALFYVHNLRTEKAYKHVEYIRKRKLTDATVTKFGIGASLGFDELPKYLRGLGYTEKEMVDSGACGKNANGKVYDFLANRLIIPVLDQFGNVVAFCGRIIDNRKDVGKYVNTRETFLFSKSRTLFNLNNVKKLKNEQGLDCIIVVEGHMDVVSLVQAGFSNVVASMGTSLTKDHARILKHYAGKILICYDGDFAGQKATVRGLEILQEEGLEVKVVSLPDGKDPDEVVTEMGVDGYRNFLLEAMPLIDFKLDVIKKTFDLTTSDGKRKYIANAIKVIRESPSPSEQDELLKAVRSVTNVNLDTLRRELFNAQGDDKDKDKEIKVDIQFTESNDEKSILASRYILNAFLFNKSFAQEYALTEIDFANETHKKIKDYILDKQEKGEQIIFGNLFDEFDQEESQELSKIAELETSHTYQFDQAVYFEDCIKTLKVESLTKMISELTVQFTKETDTVKRREISTLITNLISKKTILINERKGK